MRELYDSGIEWIGIAPSSWKVAYLSSVMSERKHKNVGMQEDNLLSLSYAMLNRRTSTQMMGFSPSPLKDITSLKMGTLC